MEVKVLGPLEARLPGGSIVLSARKPRQVLSLLAICAGQVVPVPMLIEELWGFEQAPRSATQTVQTYILRLRERICANSGMDRTADGTAAAKQILSTRSGGYTLDIKLEDVDAHRFQCLATAGEQALTAGDWRAAANLLGRALDMWRGPMLVDVQAGSVLGIEVERLEQSRLSVLESRIEADLRLGRHHQLLGELAELTARYPMHERLCEQYMTALYACGCKWRALEVFQRLRQRLVTDLGIEPSVHVQQVQLAILNGDVEREPARPRRSVPVGAAR